MHLLRGSTSCWRHTYRACRGGSSGTGCSTAGQRRGAGGGVRWSLLGRETWRRGWLRVEVVRRRDRPARTPRRRRPRPTPWRAAAAGRPARKARRPPPAAAAARVSGTSHADDGVTSRAAVRATRHTHAGGTTSLAACGHSTDGHNVPPASAVTRLGVQHLNTIYPQSNTLLMNFGKMETFRAPLDHWIFCILLPYL